MKHSKTLFAALALAALPLTAAAQGEGEATVEADASATVSTDGTGEVEATANDDSAATAATPTAGATLGGYPQAVIDRPATLLKGMKRGIVDVGFGKTFTVDATTGETDSSFGADLGVKADFGVSDKIQIGLSYALTLKEFEEKGPLLLHGEFNAKTDAKMRLAVGGDVGYDLLGEFLLVDLGAYFQYNIAPNMMVYTPGRQLGIASGNDVTLAFLSLPVGFGYQVDPSIHAYALTNLATFGFADADGETFLFADTIPLAIGASYTTPSLLDIGAQISSGDLPDIADNIQFNVFARYHML